MTEDGVKLRAMYVCALSGARREVEVMRVNRNEQWTLQTMCGLCITCANRRLSDSLQVCDASQQPDSL